MSADIDWSQIHLGLVASFPAEEVGERPGKAGMTFSYIDARAVYDRLDEVVGPGNWSTAYHLLNPEACAVECTLTIHGISRADVGYPNAPVGGNSKAQSDEPLKDAYSDAVKRAAVQWGIGRYLYGKAGSKGQQRPAQPPAAQPAPRSNPPPRTRETAADQMQRACQLLAARRNKNETWEQVRDATAKHLGIASPDSLEEFDSISRQAREWTNAIERPAVAGRA